MMSHRPVLAATVSVCVAVAPLVKAVGNQFVTTTPPVVLYNLKNGAAA